MGSGIIHRVAVGAICNDLNGTWSTLGRQSLAGATVELDDGEEFSKRVTLPRFMLVGLFALAAKKKRGGEKFLLISGPQFTWWTEVPRSQVPAAMRFVARVKAAAAEAGRVEPGGGE